MTDDLVKRLRDLNDHMSTFIIAEAADRIEQAADRIEQLESSSEGWKEIADEYFDAIGERNIRIEKLEAELHSYFHRIEELQAALRLYACDCKPDDGCGVEYYDGGANCGRTASKALEGKDGT